MIRVDHYEFGPNQVATRWVQESPGRSAFMGQVMFDKDEWVLLMAHLSDPKTPLAIPEFRFVPINYLGGGTNDAVPKT